MLLISQMRHFLIEKALESLEAVNQGLELGMPVDLLQVDMTRTCGNSGRKLPLIFATLNELHYATI